MGSSVIITFGPEVLGGLLAGVTVSGVLMGIFQSNAGGAWDNAKKSFESGVEIGGETFYKKSEPHKASVTGDTVGDPFKDTSGPSMNILIKLMSIVSLIIAVLWTIPTFGLFLSSFRPAELIRTTGWWTYFANPGLTLENYSSVLFSTSSSSPQLGAYIVNSIAIALLGTLITLVFASMAAYAFAWIKFKWVNWLFIFVFALQIVPLQMALVPLLQIFSTWLRPLQAWLHDVVPIIPEQNYAPVWLAHAMFGLPLAIFLLHNFISEIPTDVIEAARVGSTRMPAVSAAAAIAITLSRLITMSAMATIRTARQRFSAAATLPSP